MSRQRKVKSEQPQVTNWRAHPSLPRAIAENASGITVAVMFVSREARDSFLVKAAEGIAAPDSSSSW